ncbi:MAG: helix-turn-helix transcriptional regulator [Gammaproteobacteria bacterium]
MKPSIDYDAVTAAFAHVLGELRAARGSKQDDFARSLGMDPSYYRGLESAVYAPSLFYLLKIAAALECAPDQLVAATRERLAVLSLEAQGSGTLPRA